MKAIAYKRNARSPYHIHAGFFAFCIYFPKLEVIVGQEQAGTFGTKDYYINESKELLDEIKIALEGKEQPSELVTIEILKEKELGDMLIKELVSQLKEKKELEKTIEKNTKKVFKDCGIELE